MKVMKFSLVEISPESNKINFDFGCLSINLLTLDMNEAKYQSGMTKNEYTNGSFPGFSNSISISLSLRMSVHSFGFSENVISLFCE